MRGSSAVLFPGDFISGACTAPLMTSLQCGIYCKGIAVVPDLAGSLPDRKAIEQKGGIAF